MTENRFRIWIFFSILSFWVVSAIGMLMRYKIGFEFPIFYQKYLLHAHSHFAFSGWVSQTLMILMVYIIRNQLSINRKHIYQRIFLANLINSYGMLISFAAQGYGIFSIVFSTLSIVLLFIFSYLFIQDLIHKNLVSSNLWLIAALFFNVISVFGTAKLISLIATKQVAQNQDAYLASIFWYLHFQYNGWFFFGLVGIFSHFLENSYPIKLSKRIFYLFVCSCIPTYGLSLLWASLPTWVYLIVVIGSVAQVYAWILLVKKLFSSTLNIFQPSNLLLVVFIVAATIKFLLQLFSVVPEISQLAFGYRPIVIAYLHLVLLAMISMLLIYLCLVNNLLEENVRFRIGVATVVTGVVLNELVLLIQGIAFLNYHAIPGTNEVLFGVSVLIFLGISQLFFSQKSVLKSLR